LILILIYKSFQIIPTYLRGNPGKGSLVPHTSTLEILGLVVLIGGISQTQGFQSVVITSFLGYYQLELKKKHITVASSSTGEEYHALLHALVHFGGLSSYDDLRVPCTSCSVV